MLTEKKLDAAINQARFHPPDQAHLRSLCETLRSRIVRMLRGT